MRDTLERLIGREPPLAVCIGRAAGQREDRYMHLLCGEVDVEAFAAAAGATARSDSPARADLHERIEHLEAEVARLRDELASLRERLDRT